MARERLRAPLASRSRCLKVIRVLTRSQVARRLGKSISTVRRLEDRALHPIVGKRNVRYFDDWEVEQLKRNPDRVASFAQSEWFKHKRASPLRGAPRKAAPVVVPDLRSLGERRALAAAELEGLFEALLDVPAARLLRAGLDEDAFNVLATAIDALRDLE
jgi:hypothetical protein